MEQSQFEAKAIIEKIADGRQSFLSGVVTDPHELPYIRSVIADSWIRSKALGVNNKQAFDGPDYSENAFKLLKKNHAFLIECALPYIRHLETLVENTEYMIGLYSADGVLLELYCDDRMKQFAASSGIVPGVLFSEEAVGTCANGLCSVLKKPTWVRGAEHYCESLIETSCVAAPIFGPDKELLGVLTMESILTEKQHKMTFAWVTNLAWSVQNHMELRSIIDDMSETKDILEDLLTAFHDIVIIIDTTGRIVYANMAAESFFAQKKTSLLSKRIESLLGGDHMLTKQILGVVSEKEVFIHLPKKKGVCKVSVSPLSKDRSNGAHSYVALSISSGDKKSSRTDNTTGEESIVLAKASRRVVTKLQQSAKQRNNLLIMGEAGTGKRTLTKRCIDISGTPFNYFDCSEYSSHLLTGELIGYGPLVFADSNRQGKTGAIQKADKGFLIINEIDLLPHEAQDYLLKALTEKRVRRLNSSEEIEIDICLIATTQHNLRALAEKGIFSEHLAKLLCENAVLLPPLRDNTDDISMLARRFASEAAECMGLPQISINADALNLLQKYNWPGNVVQLRNVITYAVSMATNAVVSKESLPQYILSWGNSLDAYLKEDTLSLKEAERLTIAQALSSSSSLKEAADRLHIGRTTLYRKMKEYDLRE